MDVRMEIEFQVAVGSTLSGSYKSILDSTSVKSVESGSVTARDSSGRPVKLSLRDANDWLQAKFTFPRQVRGDGSTKYSVILEYTILNGLCSAVSSGTEYFRFYFPWNHRWIVPVTRSTYRIELPNNADAVRSMSEVCLGGTGFLRLCGHRGLKVHGTSAEHVEPAGFAHGLFFQWPGHLHGAAPFTARRCPGCGAKEGCVAEEVEASKARGDSGGKMLPQDEDIKTSAASTVVVVLAILLCCLLAIASAFLRRKLRQWTPAEGSADPEMALKSQVDIDLPPGVSWEVHRKLENGSAMREDDEDIPEEKGSMPPLEPSSSVGQRAALREQFSPRNDLVPFQEPAGSAGPRLEFLQRRELAMGSPQGVVPAPQAIGSTATAGITIEIDDALGHSNSSVPTLEQAQRRWQGFGEYYIPDSPSGSSSPSCSPSPSRHSPGWEDGASPSGKDWKAPPSPMSSAHPSAPQAVSPVGVSLGSLLSSDTSPGSGTAPSSPEKEFSGVEEIHGTQTASSPSGDLPRLGGDTVDESQQQPSKMQKAPWLPSVQEGEGEDDLSRENK